MTPAQTASGNYLIELIWNKGNSELGSVALIVMAGTVAGLIGRTRGKVRGMDC